MQKKENKEKEDSVKDKMTKDESLKDEKEKERIGKTDKDIYTILFSLLERKIEQFQKKEWRQVVFLPHTYSYKNHNFNDSKKDDKEENKNEESEKNFPKIIEYRTVFKPSWLEKNILSLARIEQHASFSPRMRYELIIYTVDPQHYSHYTNVNDPKYYPDNDILFWKYNNIKLPPIIWNYPLNSPKKSSNHIVIPISDEEDKEYQSQMEEVKRTYTKINQLFRDEERKKYAKQKQIQEADRKNQLISFYDSIKKYFQRTER